MERKVSAIKNKQERKKNKQTDKQSTKRYREMSISQAGKIQVDEKKQKRKKHSKQIQGKRQLNLWKEQQIECCKSTR